MDMSGKTAIVAGLGVSGQSMMEVLGSRAEKVLGVDEKKPDADLHSFDHIDWDHVDLVMTSPVFNPRTPFILEAQRRGIPVMSEVELAWQLRVDCDATGHPAQWIGITGTNGKTSTTEMTSEMLTACGLTAPAVGNIGKAVSHAAVDPANDVLCVELSSFQLHFTDSLELDCAAITNIADDHLDWHGGIDNYASDKAKVFHHAKKALVYNADDERVTKLAFAAETAEGCRRVGFTLSEPQGGQIGVNTGNTRFPRSVFKGQPSASRNSITRAGGYWVTALYRNRPFRGTFCKTSSTAQQLVTLHRPLPVIRSFFPRRSLRSNTSTRLPASPT